MRIKYQDIIDNLYQFTGTSNFHQYSIFPSRKYFLTDGVNYLCKACECYWLVDFITSHQNHSQIKKQEFQVWNLLLLDKKWHISCEDGNKKVLYHSLIDSTDFPLNGITIFYIDGYLLLPSEY